MKIAFLMQCHKNPEQINCLLKALKHPQCDVFVHVDVKSKYMTKELERNKGVYVLPQKECVDVQWAKFSQVQASLNLLKAATEQGEYSHFFLISGQDYPLMPIGKIVDFLEEYKEYNFIDCLAIKAFEKRNDIYFPNILIGRKIWQKILKNVLIYITGGWNYTFSAIKRLAPNGMKYYFGSSWWCLNRKTVEWIKAYLCANPNYLDFFKNALCPDECFFQTLVMNSPYSKNVKPCLHYVQWEKAKSSPKILTTHDFNNMIQSGKMMGRKFDIEIDKAIMQELDNI